MTKERDKSKDSFENEEDSSTNILGQENPDFELKQLIDLLSKYKVMVFSVFMIFVLSSLIYSLSLEKFYRASILLVSAQQNQQMSSGLSGLLSSLTLGSAGSLSIGSNTYNSEISLSILTSRRFLESYIEEKNLLPVLYKDEWNSETKEWISKEIPTLLDAYNVLLNSMKITFDKSLIILTVEWREPIFTAQLANGVVSQVNEHIRDEAIEEGSKSILFLEKELNKTNLSSTKQMLYRLVEQQIQTVMLANVWEEYAFKVIDPALEPIHPSGPNRRIIVFIASFVGLIIGILSALILNYFQSNKRNTF